MGAEHLSGVSSCIVASGYEPVREAFEGLLADRVGWSGAVAAYVDGQKVVDLWGGPDWRADSLVLLYSASKGLAATVVGSLVEDGSLELDAPVAEYWPEFGAAGKEAVTVRVLCSHQAGLPEVDRGATLGELVRHEPVARKLAAQRPAWEPGTDVLYHGVTIGPLLDELVRRVTGSPLRDVFRERITMPLGCERELYLGLPASEDARLVDVLYPPEILELWSNLPQPNVPNDVGFRQFATCVPLLRAGVPSVSGVGSARGLARVYAACVSSVDGVRLLRDATIAATAEPQVFKHDDATGTDISFSIGYQGLIPGRILAEVGGPGSFGHDGAGGAVGFASPRHGLGFGFTPNTVPVLPGLDLAAAELAAATLRCAEEV
jgi:CubicO group peptidase (beta-lactamase class C family)